MALAGRPTVPVEIRQLSSAPPGTIVRLTYYAKLR